MQTSGKGRWQVRKICALILCISSIFMGTVFCGQYTPPNYNQFFSASAGACQGENAAATGEQALALAVASGPNITICMLRASDGILLRHYDLAVHGDVIGQGNGQIYLNERDGTAGTSRALCSININDGVTRWCQTSVTDTTSVTSANGTIYALAMDHQSGINTLTALNERDGRVLWNFQTGESPSDPAHTLLALGRNALYISVYGASTAGSSTPGSTYTRDHICALRADSGQIIWCALAPAESLDGMIADDHSLYVLTGIGVTTPELITISANGSAITSVTLPELQQSTGLSQFFIAQNMIFIDAATPRTGNDILAALRPGEQTPLWSAHSSGPLISMQAWINHLYTIDEQGKIEALNLLDGKPAWSYPGTLPLYGPILARSPAGTFLTGSDVIYMLANGPGNDIPIASRLLALHASDGTKLWEDQGCDNVASASTTDTPAASQGTGQGTGQHCYWKANDTPDYGYNSYGNLQAYNYIQLLQLMN